jgi:pimeloyl-ACP methyl ester carboxylesterase
MSARVASMHTRAEGLRLHARVTREPVPAGRTPLVLVHGMVVSSRYMRPLLETLGSHFTVYAPDLPGYGRSARGRTPARAEALGEALVQWMDSADLAEADLLGNSFGCQIAVEAALAAPHRVRRLVLQGPTLEPQARSVHRALTRFLRNGPREPASLNLCLMADYLQAGLWRSVATFWAMLRHHLEERVAHVRAPTLVVAGALDPIAPLPWCERLVQSLPHGELTVLQGTAHTAVYAAPRQLARAVRPFLLAQEAPAQVAPPTTSTPRFVADFDSASVMLRASSRGVEGEDFPQVGIRHPLAPLVPVGNVLPRRLAEAVYAMAGWAEGIPASGLDRVRLEEADRWMVAEYPQRQYPAVILGSPGGASVHLAAAMGAPFFPQTLLVPVRRLGGELDDLEAVMRWGAHVAPPLLEHNPDHALHHMHDPNQDQLMARHMGYFRMKRLRLGEVIEEFLATRLAPQGTVFIMDCQLRWPVRHVAERHVFQAGGVGALTPEEYLHGGPRVAAFMRQRGRRRLSWRAAEANGSAPEAEWGLEPALVADVERVARALGLRVERVPYDEPQSLSAAVADLHRMWFARLGRPVSRFLVESFVLTEPTWALRTSSVPYWCVFPVEPAAQALEQYLEDTPGARELFVLAFSHGVESAGYTPATRWQELVEAVGAGCLAGVDARAYPRDFASLVRYHRALERCVHDRYPLPEPLAPEEVAHFLALRSPRQSSLGA